MGVALDDRPNPFGKYARMNVADTRASAAPSNIRWTFHSANDFARFFDQWDEINQAASGIPILSAAFVALLLKEFGTGRERLAVGFSEGVAIAITVLERNHNGFCATFQPAQAPIGAWVHRPPATLETLIPSLLRKLPGFVLAVGVTQQDPELVQRPDEGGIVQTLDYIQTARVTIAVPFDEYWAARGKNLRNNTKRQRSRLEKEGVPLRLETITDPADVAQAIIDYGRLESAGWKGAEGTAIHPDNAQGRFYRALLENYCRNDAGRIYRYCYGNVVAAVDLCIENRDTLIVLKTTYDEAIQNSSPASLMRHEYFQKLFDEGKIKRIEFYGRVMDWHTKWTNEVRTMYHVNYYRWHLLPKIRSVLRDRKGPVALTDKDDAAIPATNGLQSNAVASSDYVVSAYEDFTALPGRCAELFTRAGNSSLFFTLLWYRNFIQSVLTSNDRLRIYVADAAGSTVSARAVLLMRHANTDTDSFGPKILSGLCNYYSSLFGLIVDPREPDLQSLTDSIAAAMTGGDNCWDIIDLHPLAMDESAFPAMVKAFKKSGLLVQTYFCFGNWYLQVRDRTYEAYFKALPSKIRNTIKKKREQLENSDKSKIVVYRDASGLDEALNAYEAVYAASWKVTEPYPEFIRGLCRACASSGWLRLGILYVDEQPIAAQIWIVYAGVATIYKLAYDERYAKLSPGTVLTAHLMEHVVDTDKVREVDYLTGDDAYKKDWMSDRRERWGIVAFNPRTPRGLLAFSRHLGGRVGKNALDLLRGLGTGGERTNAHHRATQFTTGER